MDLLEVHTKKVYAELVSKLKERLTAQIRFEEMFPAHNFDWKKIYKLPNFKLHWIHILANSNINYLTESFSQIQNYSKLAWLIRHCVGSVEKKMKPQNSFFLYCHYANSFWTDISTWLKRNCNIDFKSFPTSWILCLVCLDLVIASKH